MSASITCRWIGIVLTLICAGQAAHGQKPAAEVVIGQSAGYTGRTSSSVKEFVEGSQAYFDYVNRHGGVAGRTIFFNTLDDGYFPELTAKNTKQLIEEDKVFALFGYYGDATVNAALPILTKAKVPLIGPLSGAESLRTPVNPYVFNVRASFQVEVEKIVAQAAALGLNKIALFYQDDEFGKDAQAGLEKAMKKRGMAVAASGPYQRNSVKVDDAVGKIAAAQPQSIVMACTLEACTEFVRQIKKRGLNPRFNHLSVVEAAALYKELGDLARGLEITRVVPLPWDISIPVVNEYQKVAKEIAPKLQPSFGSLEGFISAKVVVEGLKRAGPNADRAKFIAALETMQDVDFGGYKVSYSKDSHRGSEFADITIIGPRGKSAIKSLQAAGGFSRASSNRRNPRCSWSGAACRPEIRSLQVRPCRRVACAIPKPSAGFRA
jgi:branched-chain amino acid transport system substrate-binding protein